MASFIYNSAWEDMLKGVVDIDTNTIKCMLVTSAYVFDSTGHETAKDSHLVRSSVTTNEVSGTGYTSGGKTVTCSVAKDTGNNYINVTLGAPADWTSSTITARGAVYYKDTGSAATDNLIAYIEFTSNVSSTNGTFSLTASTMRIQN